MVRQSGIMAIFAVLVCAADMTAAALPAPQVEYICETLKDIKVSGGKTQSPGSADFEYSATPQVQ